MAKPTTREQHKQYCLRSLGKPVVDINVDDEQLEDRIDESLQYFRDYHYDGTEHVYLKHQITSSDKTNEYISVNDNIQGITRLFNIGDTNSSSNIFNIRYQMHLNDLFDFSSATSSPYVNAMRHVEQLEEIFVGKKPIRFNRHMDRLYIDMDWTNDVAVDDYIIIDAYRTLDTDTYTDVWNDRWLLQYSTALFKRQWGLNLSKFAGLQLPGGITLDGPRILQEATEEINRLEEAMITNYSPLVHDMTG